VAGVDDPYSLMGVARDASEQQIRRAYRRLAKQVQQSILDAVAGRDGRRSPIAVRGATSSVAYDAECVL